MIRDATRDDIVDVINLAHQYMELAIEGYKLDKLVWITNCLTWLAQSEQEHALFKVSYDGDNLRGFMVGTPVSWHYSEDIYLDIKEMFVDEDLPAITKAKIVLQFTKVAEEKARENNLKGLSAFSIRDNSQSYANFFINKLGWQKASGAKLIF